MDNEKDETSNDVKRVLRRSEDSTDRSSQENDTSEGLQRNGAASQSMEQGWERDPQVNESTLSELTLETYHSGPLPSSAEFAGYERTLRGAADRILTMSEQSLQASIEAQREITKIYAEDRKAENWVYKFTSATLSLILPAIVVVMIAFLAVGKDTAALITLGGGVGVALPRTIEAIKGTNKQHQEKPKHHDDEDKD